MKKIPFFLSVVLFSCHVYAQVGIQTTTPNAQLDITATNQALPLTTDGLLIPRIDQFPSINPSIGQDSMLVYLTTTDGTNVPGFYYWNHATTTWIGIPGEKVEKIDDLLDAKSDADASNPGSSIFLGIDAGSQDNSTDNQNIGIGYQSLQNVVNAIRNVGIGYRSLQNNTNNNNVGVGFHSLLNNTSGFNNVAIGSSALRANSIGQSNVAVGYNSQFNTIASSNTSVGNRSMELNTTGFENNAFGYFSLRSNTTGAYNNAMGVYALNKNTTGPLNSAFGHEALARNTTGGANVAFGARTLSDNTTGIDNVAIGTAALFKSVTANRNIAIGSGALGGPGLSGDKNIAIGSSTLSHNTTGTNNIAIGDRSSRFTNNSNTVTLGNSSHNTYLMFAASWTQASDRSLKHDIKQIPVGLDFVKQLNPVEYVYNNAAKETDKTFGFIAQEIDTLIKKSDIQGSAIVGDIGNSLLGLKQTELIPVLTKAIQEQQVLIEALEKKLAKVSSTLDQLLEERK